MKGQSMRNGQRGLSIIELMIALTLGLVLMAGVVQVFLANKVSQRMEQSISRVQENGRVALDLITQDLRSVAYIGCAAPIKVDKSTKAEITVSAKDVSVTGSNFARDSLRGYSRKSDSEWKPALPSYLSSGTASVASARVGSDVVFLYTSVDTGARVSGTASGTSAISVERASTTAECFEKKDVVLISNCTTADLVTVTNDPKSACAAGATVSLQHDSSLNTNAALSATYSSPSGAALTSGSRARVLKFSQNIYSIRDTNRKYPDGSSIFALYRSQNGAAAQELVEGVEFLKIQLGEQMPNNNLRYVTPEDTSINWENVVSARIGVLVRGFESIRDADDGNTYVIADQSVGTALHGGGRPLRQAFTVTVELRNRMQ